MTKAVRWRLALAAAVAVAVAVPIVSVAGAPAERTGPLGTIGWFHTDCTFSHRAPDDPIVYPGKPGASHMHDFFGNRSLDANSTPESLLEHLETTCFRGDEVGAPGIPSDRSAYWVPALYAGGPDPIPPLAVNAGYGVGPPRDYGAIEPFPDDLRVIAGSAAGADPRTGAARIYLWRCGGQMVTPGTSTSPPICDTPDLRLDINFPDCWDGADSDSANHKSHMAYSQPSGGAAWECPATHPVLVPRLSLKLRYPTTGGPSVRLASGAINTAHADFMNGWDPDKFAELVRDCVNVDKYCGGASIPVHDHGCAKAQQRLERAKAKLRKLRADDDAKAQEIRKAKKRVKKAKRRKRRACA
jgi:Domain of unknown function (DUF1996)